MRAATPAFFWPVGVVVSARPGGDGMTDLPKTRLCPMLGDGVEAAAAFFADTFPDAGSKRCNSRRATLPRC
jgi:hypothetical protein